MIYLPDYFQLEESLYHPSLKKYLANQDILRLLVIGHRGSAKSTIGSLALPLYMALELPHLYQFIIPIADTALQAGINVANIKNELENNVLILKDYGKFKISKVKSKPPDPTLESDEEWQAKNMLLNNGVRILARSRGQKVRGLRHRQHRPKAVIVDDPEDLKWVRFKENRDETEKWLRGEVIPAMDERMGKLVLIGNYLHDDALMARAKKWGTFKLLELPLIDPRTGLCTWPAKYPTLEALTGMRQDIGETSWQREMLLKVVAEEGAPVRAEDITYYEMLPENIGMRGTRAHGVDLAISQKASADYTTCVDGDIYYEEKKAYIYILPNPLNEHLLFDQIIDHMIKKQKTGGGHMFFVEDVGFQKAAIQEMERNYVTVTPVPTTTDKLSRLRIIARHIRNGTIRFPRRGCEDLINQLINFGVESHDDLADGLSTLVLGLIENGMQMATFIRL